VKGKEERRDESDNPLSHKGEKVRERGVQGHQTGGLRNRPLSLALSHQGRENLIIELDGGQHAEQVAYDGERSAWLQSQGFQILRFWNHEVLQDTETVMEVVLRECERKAPSL